MSRMDELLKLLERAREISADREEALKCLLGLRMDDYITQEEYDTIFARIKERGIQ